MFAYIYEDAVGVTKFDRYFSYLNEVCKEMPVSLRDFALDPSRYDLQTEGTLHDAWIESINFENEFCEGSNLLAKRSVTINLILSDRKNRLKISYGAVESYEHCHVPIMWPDRALDLLTHEIRVEGRGLYSHQLMFDRGVWLKLKFREFTISSERCKPTSA